MLGVREALAAEPEGQGDASVRDVVGVAEVVGNVVISKCDFYLLNMGL
jgi:hypothetical protein